MQEGRSGGVWFSQKWERKGRKVLESKDKLKGDEIWIKKDLTWGGGKKGEIDHKANNEEGDG